MKQFGLGTGIAIFMAAWVTACSGDVTGGGDGPSLAEQGTIGDSCGPADGPAIAVKIGGAPSCGGAAADATPFVQFAVNSASMNELVEGQSWSVGQGTGSHGVGATWFPGGPGGDHEPVQSGSIEVISISGSDAVVRYQFLTPGGETYSGEATVAICPQTQKCA